MATRLTDMVFDLPALTVRAARAGLRARAFTSAALTQAFLDRISALNPRLNVYLTVDAGAALAQAAAADARIAAGEDTPLLGVPIALKDVLVTRGLRTTYSSSSNATKPNPAAS